MTIYGWDQSHYDSPPNAAKVIGEGFSFITHKAGGDASDQEIDEYWVAVKPHRAVRLAVDSRGDQYLAATDGSKGLLVGAYWVVRPDLVSSATSNADQFLARLDANCPGWREAWFILQADCESWGDPSGKKKPNKAYVKAFCDRLRVKAPKLMPIVYASKGDYGNGLSGLGYPLWNARYSLSNRTGTASGLYAAALAAGSGWGEYSGQVPEIWQFTSSATIAGQTTCDANAYRGTLADLTALLAPGWEQEEDTMDKADFLALLKDPDIAAQLGAAVLNKTVPDPRTGKPGPAWTVLTGTLSAVQSLSAGLAGQVAATIVPLLPSGAQITEAQLEAAFVAALKQLAADDEEPTA